jgi:hypothetical protein
MGDLDPTEGRGVIDRYRDCARSLQEERSLDYEWLMKRK